MATSQTCWHSHGRQRSRPVTRPLKEDDAAVSSLKSEPICSNMEGQKRRAREGHRRGTRWNMPLSPILPAFYATTPPPPASAERIFATIPIERLSPITEIYQESDQVDGDSNSPPKGVTRTRGSRGRQRRRLFSRLSDALDGKQSNSPCQRPTVTRSSAEQRCVVA